jgi:hypothetical protein
VKHQPIARMPKAGIAILALSLIALVLFAGHSQTGPPSAAAQNQLVWVRQEPPVINWKNAPTYYEYPEVDVKYGSFTKYTLAETEIIRESKLVDMGQFYYHVSFKSNFDRPPQIIYPDTNYKVRVEFSHTFTAGDFSKRSDAAQFNYYAPNRSDIVEPIYWFHYNPAAEHYDGPSSEWTINVKPPRNEGQTFEMRATWGEGAYGDPPANVTWTYRAEQNTPVEEARLGAEVIAPVVKYQGEEVPVGEMFFPETCPLPGDRATDSCTSNITLSDRGRFDIKCVSNMANRLQALLQLVDFSKNKEENEAMKIAIAHLAIIKIAENCSLPRSATSDYELGLVLEQGAILLNNALDGQTVDIITPAGSAGTSKMGGFLTAYNPATNTATFQSHGAPLTVQPKTGPPLVLQPNQQVKVTSAGAGPVTGLPHLFLPLQVR